jgi:hypothetical protein
MKNACRSRSNKDDKQANPNRILVVGDWVIDENWIVAGYDSESSSHTGLYHLRSTIKDATAQILGLCAAGHVARALHCLSPGTAENEPLDIYGLGLWEDKDTRLIASLFSSYVLDSGTPLNLIGPSVNTKGTFKPNTTLCKQVDGGSCQQSGGGSRCRKSDGKIVVPHSEYCCYRLKTLASAKERWGTARTIRMYDVAADKTPTIAYRVDWQLDRPNELTRHQITDQLGDFGSGFRHIVVADHNHGCVTQPLIQALCALNKGAKWYVRTKDLDAPWLPDLEKQRLILRFIGADCVPDRTRTKRWFYGAKVNVDAVDELKEKRCHARYVVSLHNDNSMLVLSQSKKQKTNIDYLLGDKEEELRKSVNVGRSSIVFASCVADFVLNPDRNDLGEVLQRASQRGHSWSRNYTEALKGKNAKGPITIYHGDYGKALEESGDGQEKSEQRSTSQPKEQPELHWRQALDKFGIVTKDTEKTIEVWRGYSCIDGYIAVRSELRSSLDDLYHVVNRFVHKQNKDAPLNCLFLGNPGLGKSFLAEQLAKTLHLRRFPFNLSQLTSLDQVVDCFDAIASFQNRNRSQTVIAFFDEIDAKIENQELYSLFLSPMSDGTYSRGGNIFRLAPCVLVFAGASPYIGSTRQKDNSRKYSKEYSKVWDFNDRINGPKIRLSDSRSIERATDKQRTEQVYWGVHTLRRTFTDVSKVSEEVLEFFHTLDMDGGPRAMKPMIQAFRNIQNGEVCLRNLPPFSEKIDRWAMRWIEKKGKKLRGSLTMEARYGSIIKTATDNADISVVDDPPTDLPEKKSSK